MKYCYLMPNNTPLWSTGLSFRKVRLDEHSDLALVCGSWRLVDILILSHHETDSHWRYSAAPRTAQERSEKESLFHPLPRRIGFAHMRKASKSLDIEVRRHGSCPEPIPHRVSSEFKPIRPIFPTKEEVASKRPRVASHVAECLICQCVQFLRQTCDRAPACFTVLPFTVKSPACSRRRWKQSQAQKPTWLFF